MSKKILLLTDEQKHDMSSFWENVGPDYEYTGNVNEAEFVVVIGKEAMSSHAQQIRLAQCMKMDMLYASDCKQACGQIKMWNDFKGRRNMEFAHTIGYER